MITWIVNASPLILLGKIGRLDLLEALAPTFIVPTAVASEILDGPDRDPAKVWIRSADGARRREAPIPIPPEIIAWDLGAGETAVIALALAHNQGSSQLGCVCILDDLAARNCAEVFQLPVMGTLGILVKARRAGLIPQVRPEIDRLLEVGSLLGPDVIQRALVLAGEAT